jgi:hypothetical protein
MPFNEFDSIELGRKGGQARTPAKRKAARLNGRLSKDGGRPRTTTLAEFILRKKLNAAQHRTAVEGYFQLTPSERYSFKRFFRLDVGQKNLAVELPFTLNRKDGVRPTNSGPHMQHILAKFRLVARYRLAGGH